MIKPEYIAAMDAVLQSEEASFSALAELARLDPAKDFRFADLSGIDFGAADLRGYDFTGATLEDCVLAFAVVDETTIFPAGTDLHQRFAVEQSPIVHDFSIIESDPRFAPLIDSETEKLKEIIAPYQLKNSVRCGLRECRTPHYKGYIVLTENGHTTNIGNHCGNKYFGGTYDALVARFKYNSRREGLMGLFNNLYPLKGYIEQQIKVLDQGEDRLGRAERAIKSYYDSWPLAVKTIVHKKAELSDVVVTEQVRVSEDELARRKAMAGKGKGRSRQVREFDEVIVGRLIGLDAIAQPAHKILETIREFTQKLDAISPDELSNSELNKLRSEGMNTLTKLDDLKSSVEASEKFFTDENIELLRDIAVSTLDRQALERVIWNREDGVFIREG